jgi:diaminohydroxyphosphoribosylaminopyrimidine deaminase/5-amino-6-(5-phosphoribosylamino)uracil reductase
LLATSTAAPIWLIAAVDRSVDAALQGTPTIGDGTAAHANVKLSRVPVIGGQLWLPAVMEELVAGGVTRLLVEGGPRIWRTFADGHLVDAVHLFQAGRPDETSARRTLAELLGPLPLERANTRLVGPDTHFEFRTPALRSLPPLPQFSSPSGT